MKNGKVVHHRTHHFLSRVEKEHSIIGGVKIGIVFSPSADISKVEHLPFSFVTLIKLHLLFLQGDTEKG